MANTTIKLPPAVQALQLSRDVEAQMRRGVQSATDAVKRLWAIEELPRTGSIEEMTTSWAQSIIAEGINATKADKSLTVTAKGERLKEWRSILKEAEQLTEIVQSVIASWPELVWCYDPEAGDVSVSEACIDKVVEQRSTLIVPGAAHTHWAKLQSILAAIEDLRKWERELDVHPFLIRNAENCTPSKFAEMWAMGNNAVDHRYDRYAAWKDTGELII